jgi:hypothetical protein
MKSCGKINLSIGPWGGANSNQFAGGVEMDDKRVYIIPYSASAARFFDPASMTLHIPSGNFSGTANFIGCEETDDHMIYITPFQSTVAKVYNQFNNTLINVAGGYHSGGMFRDVIKLTAPSVNGRLFPIPFNTTTAIMVAS